VLMGVFDGFAHALQHIDTLGQREALKLCSQGAAVDELHQQLPVSVFVFLEPENSADASVVKTLLRFGLALEPLDMRRTVEVQPLDGQQFAGLGVSRSVDPTDCSLGDRYQSFEASHHNVRVRVGPSA